MHMEKHRVYTVYEAKLFSHSLSMQYFGKVARDENARS